MFLCITNMSYLFHSRMCVIYNIYNLLLCSSILYPSIWVISLWLTTFPCRPFLWACFIWWIEHLLLPKKWPVLPSSVNPPWCDSLVWNHCHHLMPQVWHCSHQHLGFLEPEVTILEWGGGSLGGYSDSIWLINRRRHCCDTNLGCNVVPLPACYVRCENVTAFYVCRVIFSYT